MSKLGVVEDTLFVPMLGRIYASEHYPQILYDKKALELKKKLPSDLIKQNMQSQYTLLASASRSANMDRIIRTFLERRPDGVIVQLGCGLETTYHRCDNGKTHWYAVDLPHVIEYRRGLLPSLVREEVPADIRLHEADPRHTSVSSRYHIGDRLSPDHSPVGHSHRPVCVPEKTE